MCVRALNHDQEWQWNNYVYMCSYLHARGDNLGGLQFIVMQGKRNDKRQLPIFILFTVEADATGTLQQFWLPKCQFDALLDVLGLMPVSSVLNPVTCCV